MFEELKSHYKANLKDVSIKTLLEDKNRVEKFKIEKIGLLFDYSKSNLDIKARDLLLKLAHDHNLLEKSNKFFAGEIVNVTENRPALHMALRGSCDGVKYNGVDIHSQIRETQRKMEYFTKQVHERKHLGFSGKKINKIVNIGIGGSDLGPVFACEALAPFRQKDIDIEFISSVDGYDIAKLFTNIDIESTLFVIASKTFTTQETMMNANYAKNQVLKHYNNQGLSIANHFVALSTNLNAVSAFGIDPKNMFEFWDFIGGRYSLMSAIGLSAMLYIGVNNFNDMQKGALSVDKHFIETTDYTQNIPVMLALNGIWNINILGHTSLVISPYNTRLKKASAYIEQLEMESNGKSVKQNGDKVNYNTAPVIWGDSGINGQHAYYQMLHQGSQIVPMDIILAINDKYTIAEHHDVLVSNAFAQAQAFAVGKTQEEAYQELIKQGIDTEKSKYLSKHKEFAANRPTNILLLNEINPYSFGQLIAIYEHKTFVQGVIWDINSFDQMGVELGKKLASNILDVLHGATSNNLDNSTSSLIKYYQNNKSTT